jgi:hypothetical protein
VTDCSNANGGIFLSVLVGGAAADVDRDHLTFTPRNMNFATHQLLVSTRNFGQNLKKIDPIFPILFVAVSRNQVIKLFTDVFYNFFE